MPGSFVQRVQDSGVGSSATLASNPITTSVGNTLALIVTYSGATTTVTPNSDFGTFTEDLGLRHAAAGGVGMHVFTIDSCLGVAVPVTITYGASRPNRGLFMVEMAGVNSYLGGVFPPYQVAPGTGGDAITSGNFNVTVPPNYLLGFAWDQSGGGTAPAVGASSAGVYTSRGNGFFFGDATANARVMDTRSIASGNIAATFSDTGGAANTYAALLLAFAEDISTQLLMPQCMY